MKLSDAIEPIDMTKPITEAQRRNVIRRYWPKVAVSSDGCWEWLGSKVSGYGQLGNIGAGGNPLRAHRLAVYLHFGPLAPDAHIDHLCRNRACVNPSHLEVVSQAENNRRAAEARVKATHCPRGHEHVVTYGKRGRRTACRTCHNEASRRHYLKKKGGVA